MLTRVPNTVQPAAELGKRGLIYRTGSLAKGRKRLTVLLAAQQNVFIFAEQSATYKGCPLLGTPRTDPDRPDFSIRLLPRVFGRTPNEASAASCWTCRRALPVALGGRQHRRLHAIARSAACLRAGACCCSTRRRLRLSPIKAVIAFLPGGPLLGSAPLRKERTSEGWHEGAEREHPARVAGRGARMMILPKGMSAVYRCRVVTCTRQLPAIRDFGFRVRARAAAMHPPSVLNSQHRDRK